MSAAQHPHARSPSVAGRQYGHDLPGEEVRRGPGKEALLDFVMAVCVWVRAFQSMSAGKNDRAAPAGERNRCEGQRRRRSETETKDEGRWNKRQKYECSPVRRVNYQPPRGECEAGGKTSSL